MIIMVPGFEGAAAVKAGTQRRLNATCKKLGVEPCEVDDIMAAKLFIIVVKETLAMGMVGKTARAMQRYNERSVMELMSSSLPSHCLEEFYDDLYCDVMDPIVCRLWEIIEPRLPGLIPFDVDVFWRSASVVIMFSYTGETIYSPRRQSGLSLDPAFSKANLTSVQGSKTFKPNACYFKPITKKFMMPKRRQTSFYIEPLSSMDDDTSKPGSTDWIWD